MKEQLGYTQTEINLVGTIGDVGKKKKKKKEKKRRSSLILVLILLATRGTGFTTPFSLNLMGYFLSKACTWRSFPDLFTM
jgi:hypothetical protein